MALRQVGVDFRGVVQVMRDDLVNVRQRDGWKLLRDFLGSRAALERRNDGIEGHAGASNANRAVRVGNQGNDSGCKNGGHMQEANRLRAKTQTGPSAAAPYFAACKRQTRNREPNSLATDIRVAFADIPFRGV